jgi:hypothetical protein
MSMPAAEADFACIRRVREAGIRPNNTVAGAFKIQAAADPAKGAGRQGMRHNPSVFSFSATAFPNQISPSKMTFNTSNLCFLSWI